VDHGNLQFPLVTPELLKGSAPIVPFKEVMVEICLESLKV
jgi:hypothetical protein